MRSKTPDGQSNSLGEKSEVDNTQVIALIMAAGVARRFGSDKRCHRLADGRTLLATVIENVCPAFTTSYLVTRDATLPTGVNSTGVDSTDIQSTSVTMLSAPQAANGLGGSLGDAFRQLIAQGETATAAAVVLGDMPWLTEMTCRRLNQVADAVSIVVPALAGRRGHPVIFGRDFWPELAMLRDGDGAREIVARHPQALRVVDVEDSSITRDVDRPQDLA